MRSVFPKLVVIAALDIFLWAVIITAVRILWAAFHG